MSLCIALVVALALFDLRSSVEQTAFHSEPARDSTFATFVTRESKMPEASRVEAPMRAVIVASPRDCRGNLQFANVLRHRGVAAVVGAPELVVAGLPNDTIGLRPTLPVAVRRAQIRLLTVVERNLLHSIGHHETPIMLLYDHHGRLRFATAADSDPVARTAGVRAIRHLTTRDPTH